MAAVYKKQRRKTMLRYILKRTAYMFFTFIVIIFICFVLIRMLPPVPLPPENPTSDIVNARREALGYSKPYVVQFFIFVKNAVTNFDFGISDALYYGRDVASVFFEKLPATVSVNLFSIIISVPIGIIIGAFAALKKDSFFDHTISTLSMISISVPCYIFALLIQFLFSSKLGVFDYLVPSTNNYFNLSAVYSMTPAILSLSIGTAAGFIRTTRAELTETLTGEYMFFARAKGMTKCQATIRHALRNAMVVVLPGILGAVVGVLSGSPIIERIFGIPGVGELTLRAIAARDYPIFMLSTCFYTAVGLTAGLVVDLSCSLVDPRIRMGAKK